MQRWPAGSVGAAVRVRVPASSANIGPGFDSIGLALGIWDDYTVTLTAGPGPVIDVVGQGADTIPRDERHLVYRCLQHTWAALGVEAPAGVRLSCVNAVPHGRGLGSSATAIVAGTVAAQALWDLVTAEPTDLDAALDRTLTNNLASAVEGHPDNASASVFGGMTLSWSLDDAPGEVRSVPLKVSPDVVPLVFVPAEQLSTAHARSVLPETVPHADAARGAARAALLVEAVTARPDLLLPATRDWLHQEQRREAYPASMALVDALRGHGHAAVISGAGPSVLVLTTAAHVAAARSVGRGLELGQGAGRARPGARPDATMWEVIEPGVPGTGAYVDRVTLNSHSAETAQVV